MNIKYSHFKNKINIKQPSTSINLKNNKNRIKRDMDEMGKEFAIKQPSTSINLKNNKNRIKRDMDGDMDLVGKEFAIKQLHPSINLKNNKNRIKRDMDGDIDLVGKEFAIKQLHPSINLKNNKNGIKGDMDGDIDVDIDLVGKEFAIKQLHPSINLKNNKNGIKGDIDGDIDLVGNEKWGMNPRFVYLYKNKFEMEAVSNKYDMNGLSPLSGYEPKYNPNYWNNNKNIKNNNNCYSYSVNNKNIKFGKPQPGYFARYNHIQNNQYKCAYFFKRILNDIPSVYLTSFKQKCKKGFHKAFFAIDSNKNEHDYHFYRQDNNQLWSHKPGTTNVINYDADYKIIINPYNANRDYNTYNYDKPCFFFCVNNKFGKTKAKI